MAGMVGFQPDLVRTPASHSRSACRPIWELVRARGIEPRFQAWEAHVIAVILRPRLADVPSRRASEAVKRAAGLGIADHGPCFDPTSWKNLRDVRIRP